METKQRILYLKKILDENPDYIRDIRASDGNIYFMPFIGAVKTFKVWMLRGDWLDKLGLEVPVTLDDWYNVLKAFKEQVLAEVSPTEKAELLINFTEQMYKMSATLIKYDREIEKKRAMLLAIEKESGMTLAAMLRTIPKEPEKAANPLLEALNSG